MKMVLSLQKIFNFLSVFIKADKEMTERLRMNK